MPQLDFYYSDNLELDHSGLFEAVETILINTDDSSGVCKCRAHPVKQFRHTHCLLKLAMLKKTHRDDHFMNTCLAKLEDYLKGFLPQNCYYAIELSFTSDYYVTSST